MNANLKNINACTGCSVCSYVCKHGAIAMKESKEGFLYPVINKASCVNCGICSKICHETVDFHTLKTEEAYAFQALDENLLFNASSGGIVPTMAQMVIEQGGVYVATKYDPASSKAYWDIVYSTQDVKNSSGSKYFQIPLTKEIIEQIIIVLENRNVLFVGTPCQVSAIYKLIKKPLREKLITVDLVCGGVQSYKLEKMYLESLEKATGYKVVTHKFRGKDRGWRRKYLSVIEYSDGNRQLRLGNRDLFQRAFSNGSYLRESCYNCDYSGRNRVGDITVGDCWGIEKQSDSVLKKSKGISLVCPNTEKGLNFFEKCMCKGVISPITNDILAENKPLNKRARRPLTRNVSYKLLAIMPVKQAINVICYKYQIKKLIGRG